MPINLRYGQQAVARGFLSPERLQTVLSKQQALAAQGKKVSVRMILEKAKLLNEDQLNQIDRDLNIKVVKKRTGKLDRPGVDARRQQAPARPMGAQDFAGEAVPQFSGMSGGDPDATVFSPPPPDMQDRIRAERDRAKADARRKQEQEAAAFFGDDNASPFGADPFADDAMAPQPMQPMGGGYGGGFNDMQPEPFGGEMQPEPFGGEMQPEPFGNEMQPEPFGAYGEMQPMGGHGDLQPQGDGFGDESPFGGDPFGGDAGEPQELSRMDSSPKLSSLPAEYDGFASPEDEELPVVNAFDDAPPPPQRRGPQPGYSAPPPRQPAYAAPMADLNPAGDGFDDFGNDIRSPEELDSAPLPGPKGGNLEATMFSPPPPGLGSPRQKTGAMEKTMFSPPPPGFHPRDRQPAPEPEPEPAMDDWGEPAMDAGAGFEDAVAGADMDATVFSPPPPEFEEKRRETERKQAAAAPRGRQGADDFGDVDIPVGKRMDDVPTSPSKGDEVHPLRRGVGTSSSGIKRTTSTRKPAARTPSSQIPVSVPSDDVADELPQDDSPFSVPDDDIPDEMPAHAGTSAKGKLPPKAPKKQTGKQTGKRELPVGQVDVPEGEEGKKKKKTASRVILLFLLLLVIVIAILVLPVAYPTHGIKPLDQLREHPRAAPIYNYVQEIYDTITGAPPRKKPGTRTEDPIIVPQPPGNTPADNSEPAGNGGG